MAERSWYQQEEALLATVRSASRAAPRCPTIAGYDELRELGRGGQGVVYEAVQRSTRRRVAIKLLLDGALASEGARRRFEREVELVASLRHPNIVRLYDSGVTPEGHPYYVMECIDGVSLDDLLRPLAPQADAADQLDVRSVSRAPAVAASLPAQRASLTLFATVCEAIQHAHQRGVIHRDLKPSNIRIDNAGQPHVLDFGLAKAVSPSEAGEHSLKTMSGHFLGSLPWASPEQAEGAHTRVDLRTDVYALGVILYQMLSGGFPYPVAGPFHEVVGHILHTAPTRLRTIRTDINDELETIVRKCLEKDPDRRYQSAAELLRDVRAYLAGEPIQAKRDSAWYTLRKRLHRYRLAAAGGAVGLVLLAAFAVSVSILYSRAASAEKLAENRRQDAEAAADEARRVADKALRVQGALRGMLESLDPYKTAGRDPRLLHEMLTDFAARLPTELSDHPDAEAEVRGTLGMALWSLGDAAAGHEQYRAQHAIFRRLYGEDDSRTLISANHLGLLALRLGRRDEAKTLLAETLRRCQRQLGAEHATTLTAQSNYAYVLHDLGHVEEAAELHRATLEALRRTVGPDHADAITSLNNYALCLLDLGRPADALPLEQEVLERRRRVLGSDHPDTAIACQNLGSIAEELGDLETAESLNREALAIFRERLGPQHESTLTIMNNLASVLSRRGQRSEAEPLLRTVIQTGRQSLGADHAQVLNAENNLVNLLAEQRRPAEAEPLARNVVDSLRRTQGADHPRTLTAQSNLAMILLDLGQADEAEAMCRDVLEKRRQVLPVCHPDIIVTLNNLGSLLRDAGRYGAAVTALHEALDCTQKTLAGGHWMIGRVQSTLGSTLALAQRFDEAEPHLLEGHRLLRDALGEQHPYVATARQRLSELYTQWGRPERAAEFAGPSSKPGP